MKLQQLVENKRAGRKRREESGGSSIDFDGGAGFPAKIIFSGLILIGIIPLIMNANFKTYFGLSCKEFWHSIFVLWFDYKLLTAGLLILLFIVDGLLDERITDFLARTSLILLGLSFVIYALQNAPFDLIFN